MSAPRQQKNCQKLNPPATTLGSFATPGIIMAQPAWRSSLKSTYEHFHGSLPEGLTSPFFKERNVLPPDVIEDFKGYLKNTPCSRTRSITNSNNSTLFISYYNFDRFTVVFKNGSVTIKEFANTNVTVRKAHELALIKFGQCFKLSGDHTFFSAAIIYKLGTHSHDPGPWHCDWGTNNTAIISLTDPNDPNSEWTGGDLEISPGGSGPGDEGPDEKVLRTAGQQLAYSCGDAIIFNNRETLHRWGPVQGLSPSSEKIIFSLFQDIKRS